MRRLAVSTHAVERFQERVRPGLSFSAARKELLRLTEHAEVVPAPEWTHADPNAPDAVMLSDEIAVLVSYERPNRPVATTVVFRGMMGERSRSARSLRRRARTTRRRRKGSVSDERDQARWRKKVGRPRPGEDNDWRAVA